MTAVRRAIISVAVLLTFLIPSLASAATTEFRVLFDIDQNANTGCNAYGMQGVEQILVAVVEVNETEAHVTQVHRRDCQAGNLGGSFSGPLDVEGNDYSAAGGSGPVIVEAKIPYTALANAPKKAGAMPVDMRIGFVGESASFVQAIFKTASNQDIIFPDGTPVRRRPTNPGGSQTFFTDGNKNDWGGAVPLAPGGASSGSTKLRIINVFGAGSGSHFYFRFDAAVAAQNNEAPTNITLDPTTIAENEPAGTVVGTFTTEDPNATDQHEYSLVPGTGDTDNALFTITAGGNLLRSSVSYDFELASNYSIRVRSTDLGGLSVDKTFNIAVTNANDAPTDIALSASTIAENSPAGTNIGTFSSTDQDAGETFTYALVSGTGSGDNASFEIVGTQLRNTAVLDHDARSSYSIRVRTTDSGSRTFEEVFTITVTNVNEAPTALALAPLAVDENRPAATTVGTFSTTDPDAGDTFTYTLVAGTGSTDNASFTIVNNQLQTVAPFDFETKSSYSVRVRTTDAGGLFTEAQFTITVNNVNEAATDIALSANTVPENSAAATVVGTLSTTDPDAGNTHTYSLVSGAGSTDNASFNIAGNQLQTAGPFDFETKSSYDIRIRTTDAGGLSYEKTFTITVTNVNEAPVHTVPGARTTNEDTNFVFNGDGAIQTSDVDAGSNPVQVTLSITNGTLTLSGNGGLTFTTGDGTQDTSMVFTGTIASINGALLGMTYNPTPNYFGAATLTITTNDQGHTGSGGAQSDTDNVTINVTSVNDSPAITAGGTLSYTENGPAAVADGTVTVTDIDSQITGATVSITANFAAGQDVLAFTNTATITGSYNAATGVLTLTGNDSPANYQAALRSVTYSNSSEDPSTAARTLSWRVTDASAAPSNVATSTINVAATADAPVVTAGTTVNFTENGAPAVIASTLTVTDADSAQLQGATVSITANFNAAQDALAFTPVGAITGSYNPATGVLTLTGNDTAANYQTALRSVTYQNTSDNPSTGARTISFVATDSGALASAPATSTVDIIATNDVPVLTTPGGAVAYTENDPAKVIDGNVAITDSDSTNLTGATVSITANFNAAQDVLGFTATGSITGSYDTATGVLTLSGSDTLANYQTVLRSVTYRNSSDNPTTGARTITWQVTDASSGASNSPTSTINITAVNDAPAVTAGGTLNFNEGDGAKFVDTSVTVTDADSAQLQGATVTISANFNGAQDTLAFTPVGAITGSFNAGTGVLTLTGNDTPANYQTALRSVTYVNSSENPTTAARTITWQVTDSSAAPSNQPTSTVNVAKVDDAPVLTAGANLNYTENDGVKVIDNTVTVTDVDSTQLTGATVSISANFNNAQDVLAFTAVGSITGSYDPATGVLTLSGTDTLANYQTALRSVTYRNTSDNPTTGARTITWVATDATSVASAAVTSTVTINAVNDAPTIGGAGNISFTENDPATVISSAITITDPDSANLNGATISITANFDASQDVLAFTPVGSITGSYNAASGVLTLSGSDTVANYQTALRSVTYANASENPSTAARTITWQVTDASAAASNSPTSTVSVTAVHDAPVVAGTGTVSFTENAGAVTVAGSLTITDADSTQLQGATVTIGANLNNAQDVLSFTNSGAVTGNYNATTGVLTFTGTDTLAVYQTVLRSVQYNNTSDNPTTGSRTITFVVTDTTSTASAGANATVSITAANDAPSMTAGATLNYTENGAAAVVDNTVAITDADSTNLSGATVAISANFASGQDVLSFTGNGTITGSFNTTTGVLTLSGADTVANYQSVLRTVRYANTSDNPSTAQRTITWTVSDSDNAASNSPTSTVNVAASNDAPTVTVGGTVSYTEGDAAKVINNGITITDPDSTQISGGTVSITANFAAGQDVLGFTNTGTISGTYNAATGVLTLSGTDTIANYQAALRSITYQNTSNNPSTADRTVTFVVSDDAPLASSGSTATIQVTSVNSSPAITAGGTLNYTENAAASVIDNGILVSDADSPQLQGATVSITNNFAAAEDTLAFANTATITGTYNATTGVLTLTGNDSPANYQAALRSVTYANSSHNPSTAARTISWQVTDSAAAASNVATSTVNVTATNDAPTITAGSSRNFTEGDAALTLEGSLTVTDPDSTQIQGATVSITANFNASEDVLTFTNSGNVSGSYNSGTGVLTFTGTDTLAVYQTVLRSVQYSNASQNPSTLARTITWAATDAEGGTSAGATTTVNVSGVNDAPTVTAGSTINFSEGNSATTLEAGLVVSDDDSTQLSGATVSITANFAGAQDVLSFTPSGAVTGSYNAGTGVLTLSGTDTLAVYQTVLRSVTYANSSDDPSTAARTVSWVVTDTTATASSAATTTINVAATNDAPVVTAGGTTAFTENGGPTVVNGSLTVTDADSAALSGATAAITANFDAAQDSLTFTPVGSITGSYNGTTGVLTLSGSGTPAEYQTALRSVRYNNSSENPSTGTRTISFQVTDSAAAASNVATTNVTITNVADAPVVTAGATLAYTENGPATAIDNTITISDVDSTQIQGATVQITANYQSGADVLGFANTASITGSFNATNGTLTLTGTDTVANYQAALRSVTYHNTSEGPTTAARTVTWIATDTTNTPSAGATSTITVAATNDGPVVTAGNTINYNENDAPTAVAPGLGVTDVDSTNANGATVTISANYNAAQDVLAVTGNGTITGTFDSGTGVLTLTGSDSIANYQAVLRTVTYQNTSNSPTTASRTVTWVVTDDGALASNSATTTVNVTAVADAPVVTAGGTLAYTENDAATVINNGITVTDVDSTQISGATIQITGNYSNGQDVLAFTPVGSITGNFSAATGTLTLSGTDTLANYQTALRSVTYQNTSENPSTANRTVTFIVTDAEATASTGATSTITVTAVNDAPAVVAGGTLAYTENDAATAINNGITVTDVDSTNLVGATIQITNGLASAQDVLSFTAGNGITGSYNSGTGLLTLSGTSSVANYQTALRSVTYQNTSDAPSQTARTITWIVNDGNAANNTSAPVTSTVTVTAVNDAPVVTGESYELIGNTELRVDLAAGATPTATETTSGATTKFGILFNDADHPAEGDPVKISKINHAECTDVVAPFDCTRADGAVVHITEDGKFRFTPPPGATSPSFSYLVTDTPAVGTPASTSGTVTFTVNNMVWYVDRGAAAGGNGTSSNPFNSFATLSGAGGAGDVDAAGDYIFVHHDPTALNSSIELEANQRFLGEGHGLSIPVNLNGNGSPTVLVAAGTKTPITSGTDTVRVTAALPVEIRGFSLASTAGNAIDLTAAGTYSGSPTLTIAGNDITGATAEGLDVNGGATGVLSLAISNNNVTATGNGIDINRTAGSLFITAFNDNTVSAASAAGGININNAVFDTSTGDAAYTQVSGGTTTIGTSGDGVGTFGMSLTNVTGDLAFTDLDIFASRGTGLNVTSAGTFAAASGLGFRIVASGNNGTISALGGPAVNISTATANLVLSSITSAPAAGPALNPTHGVNLSAMGGTFNAAAGSITGTTTTAFAVASSPSAAVTYGGTISGITSGSGVSLTSNAGATVAFTGQLTLSTGTSAAFNATSSGTVTSTHAASTLATTTGTALNVNSTTIGAAGLRFQAVSADGAVNGIVLNGTGSAGSLEVTGTGSAGTGGTIQNTTGHAVSLTNTLHPKFSWMNIQNAGRSGIDGEQVTHVTITNNVINNVGTAAAGQFEESGISFNDGGALNAIALSGAATISNNTITNARRHGIEVQNGNGTITALNVQNNSITSSTVAANSLGHGIIVTAGGSASTTAHLNTATITGNTINNIPSGSGVVVNGGSGNTSNNTSATLGANGSPITITGNFIKGQAGAKMGQNAIIVSFNGMNGVSNFNISNNGSAGDPLAHFQGLGISTFFGGTVTGSVTVSNNRIASQQTVAAGSSGIAVQLDDGPAGLFTSSPNMNVTISNNNVSQNEGNGIRAIARNSQAVMDLTIQNNIVAAPTMTNRNGIRVDSGSAAGDAYVCLLMTGNTSAGNGVNQGIGIRKQGTVATTNDFGIVGLSPSPTTAANAAAKISADNPAGAGVDVLAGDNFVSCTQTP